MLGSRPVLVAYVLDPRLFVLLDALLDVFFLLLELQFLAVIFHVIGHPIHESLDALRTILRLLLSLLFLIKGQAHVGLQLLRIELLVCLVLRLTLPLLMHVVPDDLHCSLALLLLHRSLVLTFILEVISKLRDPIPLLSFELISVSLLLGLHFFEHQVTLLFLLQHLLLLLFLLFALDVELLAGLLQDFLIKILAFFSLLLTQFLPQFDLLFEYLSDFLDLVLCFFFLFSQLFLMKALAELLNLAPLVFTYVRGQVINLLLSDLLPSKRKVVDMRCGRGVTNGLAIKLFASGNCRGVLDTG